jgi:ELWxxDGT repeat protein
MGLRVAQLSRLLVFLSTLALGLASIPRTSTAATSPTSGVAHNSGSASPEIASVGGPATLIKDINSGLASSNPTALTNVNGTLFFAAVDASSGKLWKSDGTNAGTVVVKNIYPGTEDPANPLTNVNGTLFLVVGASTLWKSDGTGAGTILVKDVGPNGFPLAPRELTAIGNTLFFSASNGDLRALWKSDGMAAGTAIVKAFSYDPNSLGPTSLTNVNGTLFFMADDGAHGRELWKSDGTTTGTVLVKDINPGAQPSWPRSLINVNGTLFFVTRDIAESQLWKSDGTVAGTTLVKDISPGVSGTYIDSLTNVNGTLFFVSYNNDGTMSLWKSDGTAAGTVLMKNIIPTPDYLGLAYLVNVNGTLFFESNSAASGMELWKSDGTLTGTVRVSNIAPSLGIPLPYGTTPIAVSSCASLLFAASDGVSGIELWQSNGLPHGTFQIQDIAPGSSSSVPTGLTVVGSRIFFAANDNQHGRELWAMPLSAVSPSSTGISGPTTSITQVSNTFTASVTSITDTLPITYVWQATDQAMVTHTGGPSDTVAFTWDTPGTRTVTVTASNSNGGLGMDTRTITIAKGTQVSVGPASPSSLSYTDEQGHTTTIQIPAGAVTETTTLRYTARIAVTPPASFGFAGHAFSLDAFHGDTYLAGFRFQQPIGITISYGDADIGGSDERALTLDYWDGSTWIDAATTCAPASAYQRDLVANQLSLSICHLTDFALFGRTQRDTYLPIALR